MKALVTGGGGFLGSALVRALVSRGEQVTTYSRGNYPELERLGVRCARGDLGDAAALERAARGCDTLFHVAAKAGIWGPRAQYWKVNVEGTRNVLAAARGAGVTRVVFTSSPSVCFDGRDQRRVRNDLSHARRFLAHYPASKAEAERLVLVANADGLATCALRPHLMFGPGDPHLIPRLIERAAKRELMAVGDGTNEVSLTYIDNAVGAHLRAADGLRIGAAHAGKAYFIAQSEPVRLWDWIAELLAALELPPIRRRVPLPLAYAAGTVLETLGTLTRRANEPRMTRFLALQLARTHTYDPAPAREDFGYVEAIDMRAATGRLLASLRAAR